MSMPCWVVRKPCHYLDVLRLIHWTSELSLQTPFTLLFTPIDSVRLLHLTTSTQACSLTVLDPQDKTLAQLSCPSQVAIGQAAQRCETGTNAVTLT